MRRYRMTVHFPSFSRTGLSKVVRSVSSAIISWHLDDCKVLGNLGVDAMTVEERIMARFIDTIDNDKSVPREVVRRITLLLKEGKLKDADTILTVISEGVKEDGKNSQT
jgi:hypothetical protein